MRRAVLKVLLLAMAFVLLNGCKPDTDVTNDPAYYFSSFAGTVWRTKTRTAEITVPNGSRQGTLFVPPPMFDSTDPDYRAIPDMRIVNVFPPGAIVRIDR